MADDDSSRDEKPDEGDEETERSDSAAKDAGDGSGGGEGGHEKLARSMEKHADELEGRSQDVGEQISKTRDDWESKQSSESVPGAVGEPDRDA